jgi:hypothetical protein
MSVPMEWNAANKRTYSITIRAIVNLQDVFKKLADS